MAKFVKKCPYSDDLFNGFVLPDRKSYIGLCLQKTDMVTRGLVEASFCKSLIFVTLTYDPEHLPNVYSRLKDLKVFSQRYTRKKVPLEKGYKWITKKSNPKNLSNNTYRTKEIMSEYDFKNAKMRARFNYGYDADNARLGLLVPKHLSDALECLRNDMRNFYGLPHLHLRLIANGEYGESLSRPHFHIVIFDNYDYDYWSFFKTYWVYGRILQVKRVAKSVSSIKKLTAYIVGHTAKHDSGNDYQKELSPAFKIMSSYGGGIGCQALNPKLSIYSDSDFTRSLMFSLSAWDKKSPLPYTRTAPGLNGNVNTFVYEMPRYYKDKVLNYKSLPPRQFYQSMCDMATNLITYFCSFHNFHGTYDLLSTFCYLGCFGSPAELLSFFMQSNYKNFPEYFHNLENITIFVHSFLESLRLCDKSSKNDYIQRYSRRHQAQKYQDYLNKNKFNNL